MQIAGLADTGELGEQSKSEGAGEIRKWGWCGVVATDYLSLVARNGEGVKVRLLALTLSLCRSNVEAEPHTARHRLEFEW
jgi:hypothetical protein